MTKTAFLVIPLLLCACGGEDGKGGDGGNAGSDGDVDNCTLGEVIVPASGICDRPESTEENRDVFRLCIEYTGADFPNSLKAECAQQGGSFFATDRDCTKGGTLGSCVKGTGLDTETVVYYYTPRWDDRRARAHCGREDGEFQEPDTELCAAKCGNGHLETPGETCDDGNTLDGDGCDATCGASVNSVR